MTCLPPSPSLGVARDLLWQTDCSAEALGAGAYGALSGYGGLVPALLGGVLTLYVALQGWRLLNGHAPPAVSWASALLKIGFVIALATQWPAYDALAYRLLTRGPDEIAERLVGGYRDEAGGSADLVGALQRAHGDLLAAAAAAAPPAAPPVAAAAAPSADPALRPTPVTGFGAAALLLLLSSLGPLVAAKLLLAILLAMGPLAVLLLLFEGARGIAIGWARAAIALALTLVTAKVALALELTLLAPVLARLAATRLSGPPDAAQASAAVLITSVFAVMAVGGALMSALVAGGLAGSRARRSNATAEPSSALPAAAAAPPPRADRAAMVGQRAAAAASGRREARLSEAARESPARARLAITHAPGLEPALAAAALHAGPARRGGGARRSAAMDRRDR